MMYDNKEKASNSFASDIGNSDYNDTWFKYKEQAHQLLKQGAIGMIGGFLFMMLASGLEGSSMLILATMASFILAGVPYGWSLITRITGNWAIYGNLFVVFMFYGFKFAFSLFIGVTVYPFILIYSLVQSQKSKQSIRRTWLIIVALIVLFWIVIGIIAAWEARVYPERYDNNYSATEMPVETTEAVTALTFSYDPTLLEPVIQQSLAGTLEDEKKCTDGYGWPVSQPTQLHGVFFLESQNLDDPHRNIMKKLNISNAIAVVSGYFLDEGAGLAINAWEMDVWIYPNYSIDETGTLIYDAENVYCDKLRTVGMDEIMDWFSSEYADMYLTELDAGQ